MDQTAHEHEECEGYNLKNTKIRKVFKWLKVDVPPFITHITQFLHIQNDR